MATLITIIHVFACFFLRVGLSPDGNSFHRITMNLDIGGKLALVTGSSAGIGYAVAEVLAREGAKVIVNGRTEKRVENAIKQIRSSVPQAKLESLPADLGNADGVRVAVQKFPEVEILVNNVGIFEIKSFEQIPDEDWFRLFEVNVMSGIRLSRAYLAGMRKQNWGRIIFISSESALQIPAEMIHYGTTKTAQIAVSRGLAELTVGSGVTVNSILPGPTASEGVSEFVDRLSNQANQSASDFEKQFFEKMRPTSLLKRFASTEEVANLVVYVSSPLASATNGGALRVDGGVVRTII